MKKIAIMGAGGFVGRNLTECFKDKYEIYPITRKQFNILDEKEVKCFFEKKKIDVVIHCANEGGSRKTGYDKDKSDLIGNNLKMFFNLERCLTSNMKMISFGSGAQYDKARDLVKIKEEEFGKFIPKDDYGYGKYILSKYIGKCSNIYNPIIFGLFGKYEDYSYKFISNAILKNILKMPIKINQNVMFDYLYLKDFLKIIEFLIDNDCKNKEFNITPTESIDLITIAKYINNCSDYKSEIIVGNDGLNYEYTGDNKRLLENISGYSFMDYQDSINELYQYYINNLDSINTDIIRKDEYLKNCRTSFR